MPFWLTDEVEVFTIRIDGKANGTLRLYCIRVSDRLLILGGGGEKKTKTYQEDPILFEKVHTLQEIDKVLTDLEQDGIDLSKDIINLTININ